MTLFSYEWRKLFHLPALWGFLLLCLIFNWYLIGTTSYSREPFNQVSAVTAQTVVTFQYQGKRARLATRTLRDLSKQLHQCYGSGV